MGVLIRTETVYHGYVNIPSHESPVHQRKIKVVTNWLSES